MLTETLLAAVAVAVFGYLLQEAGPAERVRSVLGAGRSSDEEGDPLTYL